MSTGHSDWTQTFYKVPLSVDTQLKKLGAKRLSPMGRANTAKDDVSDSLETWLSEQLWPALSSDEELSSDSIINDSRLNVAVGDQPPRNSIIPKSFHSAIVTETKLLSSPGVAQKRHIELQLPAEISYEAGDHLHILPTNDLSVIKRALSRFALKENTVINISMGSAGCPAPGSIPINTPLTALELFSSYFDLQRAASTRQIKLLIDAATDKATRQSLREVLAHANNLNTSSVLDLLDRFKPTEGPPPFLLPTLALAHAAPGIFCLVIATVETWLRYNDLQRCRSGCRRPKQGSRIKLLGLSRTRISCLRLDAC